MVTYDYRCKNCGFTTEKRMAITSPSASLCCPKCKKRTLARQMGLGLEVIFHGRGFYITDKRAESKT